METKLVAMILGLALILATAAVYTQSALALSVHKTSNGQNGVTDGQTAHGLATACGANSNVAEYNQSSSLVDIIAR